MHRRRLVSAAGATRPAAARRPRSARASRCRAAEHRQPLLQRDDLAPRPALRGVRPAADALVEVEEHRHHLADVLPVAGVVGLDDEQPAGHERAVDQRQERRRDEPAVDLGRVVVRLRVVAVDLARPSAARRAGPAVRARRATANLRFGQAALVAALAGVADDDRQRCRCRGGRGPAGRRRCRSGSGRCRSRGRGRPGPSRPKRSVQFRRPGGHRLQGGLRPLRRVEDRAGERRRRTRARVSEVLVLRLGQAGWPSKFCAMRRYPIEMHGRPATR